MQNQQHLERIYQQKIQEAIWQKIVNGEQQYIQHIVNMVQMDMMQEKIAQVVIILEEQTHKQIYIVQITDKVQPIILMEYMT